MNKYQELELYIEEPLPSPEKKIEEETGRTVVIIDLVDDEDDDGSIDI